ncbi:MAG: hypothetical protein RIG77_07290 [Cyclobacteriaceae bacterium]
MRIKGILMVVLCFGVYQMEAQKQSDWQEGSYVDRNNQVHTGFISYAYSQNPKFKFKSGESARERKVKATDIKGFVIQQDSFVVMNNIKIDARESAASGNIPVDFVQVVETGYLTLYRHYTSVYHGGDSYSTTHGSSIGAGSSNIIETYIIKKPESGALLTIYSEPKTYQKQLLEVFQNDPELLFKISQGEVKYSELPELVKSYNAGLK